MAALIAPIDILWIDIFHKTFIIAAKRTSTVAIINIEDKKGIIFSPLKTNHVVK